MDLVSIFYGLSEMDDDLKDLIITGVKFTDHELGRGAYGRVFAVDYNGVTCAAKMHVSDVARQEKFRSAPFIAKMQANLHYIIGSTSKGNFLRECVQHSKLHHPNIVKMLGVYYPSDQAVLPVLVMELMECNLTQLLDRHQNIPMYVKLSILQDVSRAICYLHTLNPPLMHRNLFPTNILLTTSLVAKVCDLKVPLLGNVTLSRTHDFMPPEVFEEDSHYRLPSDVFSFGCVVCHVITQQWPERLKRQMPVVHNFFKASSITVPLSEVECRSRYIDQISEESLRQLVIKCLDDDPDRRPPISLVSDRITSIITG